MKKIWIIIALALILRLLYLFSNTELWWDSGVYAGMGKYMMSNGTSGIWESSRPILLPFILGITWLTGLNIIIFGKILMLFFSLGSVYLAYKYVNTEYDETTATYTAAMLAFSPIMLSEGYQLYTEIPSIFFILLSVVLLKKSPFWAGITISLAFLAKWPAGIFIPILAIRLLPLKAKSSECITSLAGAFCFLAIRHGKLVIGSWSLAIKNGLSRFVLGTATIIIPFLAINYFIYGSPLYPLIEGQKAISQVLGCNVINYHPWWYYFLALFILENILAFFFINGIRKAKTYTWALLLIPFTYFLTMHCRDYRYIILFLPFFLTITALGMPKKKWFFWILITVSAIQAIVLSNIIYPTTEMQEYTTYFSDKQTTGELWTANPLITLYTDAKTSQIYYPVYNTALATNFLEYLKQNSPRIQYVAIDNCGGGMTCAEESCEQKNEEIKLYLDKNFQKAYDKQRGNCKYTIYQP